MTSTSSGTIEPVPAIVLTNLGPRVDIEAAFGRAVSFAELAATFHVHPREILVEFCKAHGTNREAFMELYDRFVASSPIVVPQTKLPGQRYQY